MNTVKLALFIVSIVSLKQVISHSTLRLGDSCIVNRKTRESGVCRFVVDCPSITSEWSQQSAYPTLCGIQDDEKVFFCPKVVSTGGLFRSATERISPKKCAEYRSQCSIASQIDSDDSTAAPKEFPHAAAIGFVHFKLSPKLIVWHCAGTLISEKFVLSSAYCLYESGLRFAKYVRLGDLDIESFTDDSRSVQFQISEVFIHRDGPHLNIALIKMDGNVIFNDYIRPACLANSMPEPDDHFVTIGWFESQFEQTDKPLEKVRWTSFSNAQCYEAFEKFNDSPYALYHNQTQFCAGHRNFVNQLCHYFSIASILSTTTGNLSCLHEVTAVTSIGTGCQGEPTVCHYVQPYLDWIEDIVWFEGDGKQFLPAKPTINDPLAKRKSVDKCIEYNNLLYEHKTAEPFLKCPIAIVAGIVDGIDADPKEFPHMALIGFDSEFNEGTILWACGGTLISERFVLTAAHCINHAVLEPAKHILLGDLDYSTDQDDAQPMQFSITESILHPNFTTEQKYNDIALLRLNSDVKFNEYIRPACLPVFNSNEFITIATGWETFDSIGSISSRLHKVELVYDAYQDCNEFYRNINDPTINRGIVNDTQLCAFPIPDRGNMCAGDAGGPLQVHHDEFWCMYTIVGITSFGYKYCGTNKPPIYTRVFPYADWIENIVWPNSTN